MNGTNRFKRFCRREKIFHLFSFNFYSIAFLCLSFSVYPSLSATRNCWVLLKLYKYSNEILCSYEEQSLIWGLVIQLNKQNHLGSIIVLASDTTSESTCLFNLSHYNFNSLVTLSLNYSGLKKKKWKIFFKWEIHFCSWKAIPLIIFMFYWPNSFVINIRNSSLT